MPPPERACLLATSRPEKPLSGSDDRSDYCRRLCRGPQHRGNGSGSVPPVETLRLTRAVLGKPLRVVGFLKVPDYVLLMLSGQSVAKQELSLPWGNRGRGD